MANLNCDVNSIYSNDYYDFIINYKGDLESVLDQYQPACYQVIDDQYVILHVTKDVTIEELFMNYPISDIPIILGHYGKSSLDASGILDFHERADVSLRGYGTLVGVIDSGIDYTHQCFIYEDNTSKIVSIWDQTTILNPPEGFLYGTEYSNEEINEALNSPNPYDIVPERDTNGHGTFLAGIAAGREDDANNYVGVAPDAELVVVKLKPAKEYLRDFYRINEGTDAYQNTDIITGINYLIKVSEELDKPLSILIGLGSNQGAHDGTSTLEDYLNKVCRTTRTSVSIAAGDEADKDHHYRGEFAKNIVSYQDMEINVAENERGFTLNLYGNSPDEISVGVFSPTGEFTGKLPYKIGYAENIEFLLERTVLQIRYVISEVLYGDQFVYIRFVNPTQGIWIVRVYGDLIIDGRFDAWINRMDWINKDTEFLTSNPYTTITIPSTAEEPITVGSYNHVTSALDIASGRGLTREGELKPDIVAPGVNVFGPLPRNQYGTMTGTSIAAAHVAGAAALLFEWGIIMNNDPEIDNLKIKMFLIRGARRKETLVYPNREWGYGELDLFGAFEIFKGKL